MKLYLTKKRSNVNAIAEYDATAKTFTVLKGSIVSETIAHTAKFRGTKAIEKYRNGTVSDGVVIRNTVFRSASTAANYVTGTSTNGLVAWKNSDGITLKALLVRETEDGED